MELLSWDSIHYGRQKIILDYDAVTPENVLEILDKCLPIHDSNKRDCDYLIHYFLGKQDILNRGESTTSTINNKTVVNFAYPITREIVGYTFGNPVELVQRDIKHLDDVTTLANIYNYENAYYVDICSALYGSICGFSYQMTLPSEYITKPSLVDPSSKVIVLFSIGCNTCG